MRTKESTFNFYRDRLIESHERHGQLRMIAIEYLCSFPGIDPIEMARSLAKDGFRIVFDDSSISAWQNELKRKRVYGTMKGV